MKIKIDEDLPLEVVDLFAARQHDVHTVPEESLVGCEDAALFDAVLREDRMLVTQDMDFSDIRRFKPGTHPGIVLLRLRDPSRRRLVERLRQALQNEQIESWAGNFVVVSDKKLRIRRP